MAVDGDDILSLLERTLTLLLPARPDPAGREASWSVRDVLTRESVGRGPKVRLSLKRGDTRVLRYEWVFSDHHVATKRVT